MVRRPLCTLGTRIPLLTKSHRTPLHRHSELVISEGRIYLTVHYYLADNTGEVNEAGFDVNLRHGL